MVNSIKNDKGSIWYKKNGYLSIGKCEVLTCNSFKDSKNGELDIINPLIFLMNRNNQKSLIRSFNRNNIGFNGFEKRDDSFWIRNLKNHYYNKNSEYFMILKENSENNFDYCLFSITKKNDYKLDTLELIYTDIKSLDMIVNTLESFAIRKNIKNCRIQLCNDNYLKNYLLSRNYFNDFTYDIFAFSIRDNFENLKPLKFYQIEYI